MKVLIIDDEIDLCLLLNSYFQRKGFEVLIAHTLSEGIGYLETFQPDYLFLDNNLPDGLGWEEAPLIAERHPLMHQFLISAYHPQVPAMPEYAHFEILEKPVSFADLDARFPASSSAAATAENEPSGVDV